MTNKRESPERQRVHPAPRGHARAVDEGETFEEPLALVPMIDDVLASKDGAANALNAVLGAPPPQKAGTLGAGQAIWCVADQDIAKGEKICARDPWTA